MKKMRALLRQLGISLGLLATVMGQYPPSFQVFEDDAGDAKYGDQKIDAALEMTSIKFERKGEKTLRITFNAGASLGGVNQNIAWFACYIDLDNDPETGTGMRGGIGYDVALGVEKRRGGAWTPVVDKKGNVGGPLHIDAGETVVNGNSISVEMTSDAFLKYPLIKLLGVSNMNSTFIDYIPNSGCQTAAVFTVGPHADPKAMENALDESFLFDAPGGHYDVHRVVIPESATSVRVDMKLIKYELDDRWASSVGFGLGVKEMPNNTFAGIKYNYFEEKGEARISTIGRGKRKISTLPKYQEGESISWEAGWNGDHVILKLNGEEVAKETCGKRPTLLRLSVSGMTTKVKSIEFKNS